MAQLVARLLPTLEICGSNPDIGKNLLRTRLNSVEAEVTDVYSLRIDFAKKTFYTLTPAPVKTKYWQVATEFYECSNKMWELLKATVNEWKKSLRVILKVGSIYFWHFTISIIYRQLVLKPRQIIDLSLNSFWVDKSRVNSSEPFELARRPSSLSRINLTFHYLIYLLMSGSKPTQQNHLFANLKAFETSLDEPSD